MRDSRASAARSAVDLKQLAAVAVGALVAVTNLGAQIPANRTIDVRDGDILVIHGSARIPVVRRYQGHVRALHNDTEKWLILMMDVATGPDNPPDGNVDASYTFEQISGWPLARVWSGSGTIEEYSLVGDWRRPQGIGLRTESGLLQLVTFIESGRATDIDRFKDPSTLATARFRAMSQEGSGATSPRMLSIPGMGRSFAETEQRLKEDATRRARTHGSVPSLAPVAAAAGFMQPVRVGGNVREPRKIRDVAPVLPEDRAGMKGTVLLEIVIGPGGQVLGAQAIHSNAVLAEAAISAVRQWRYEVTEINGLAVPISMTVTVIF